MMGNGLMGLPILDPFPILYHLKTLDILWLQKLSFAISSFTITSLPIKYHGRFQVVFRWFQVVPGCSSF